MMFFEIFFALIIFLGAVFIFTAVIIVLELRRYEAAALMAFLLFLFLCN